jgi:hypothetical protein
VTRIRVSSIALRWILAVCVAASPLLAQVPPQETNTVVAPHRHVVQMVDENNNPIVGQTIASAMLLDTKADAAPQERQADPLRAAPEPRPDDRRAEPGGKTWSSLLIAALIAGGVVALILLLGGHDHKSTPTAAAAPPAPTPATVTPPPAEAGTVIAPGTPSVSSH